MMAAKFAYYILVMPLSYLPLGVLYVFTDFFYLLLITVFPYRKEVIANNLKRSFPNKSDKEIKRLRNKFYHHFTDILAEGVKNLTISEKELLRRYKVKNPEIMNECFQKNRSVLLVSGHYNNWEWLITIQDKLFKHKAVGIGMPMTSKFWDKKVNQQRQRFGMHVVNAKNFKEAFGQYKEPIAVLLLSDQSPGDSRKSYWMDFLHQQTAVLFGAEQLAHAYDFSLVFFHTRKIRRGHYEMELKLLVEDPKTFGYGEITELHTENLEDVINSKPEYWIWSHKRWKREVPSDLEELKKEQRAKFESKYSR